MRTTGQNAVLLPRKPLLLDTFEGPDATVISAHPMNIGGGWTLANIGTAATVVLTSNECKATGVGNASSIVHAETLTQDHQVTCTVNPIHALGLDGVVIRFIDANNFWLARWRQDADTLDIYEYTSGYTARVLQSTTPSADPYTITFGAIGTTITASVPGFAPASYVSTTHQTGTKCGLFVDEIGGAGTTWDDFKAVSL